MLVALVFVCALSLAAGTPLQDRAYVDAFCDANPLPCIGQDRNDYCNAAHLLWGDLFTCDPVTLDVVTHKYAVSGVFPTEIELLENLRTLQIVRPTTAADLVVPSQIGTLAVLEEFSIDLSSGTIADPIPTEIGQLSTLESFDVRNTAFAGALPTEIGQWTSLKQFVLLSVLYTSVFPAQEAGDGWSDTIEEFSLSTVVGLVFDLPPFGNSPTLESYSVSGVDAQVNFDDDELPFSPNLKLLTFEFNPDVTGTLPASLYASNSIEALGFFRSGPEFELDDRIGQVGSLTALVFIDSPTSGSVGPSIGQLTNLQSLIISETQIGGPLPDTFGSLTELASLIISGAPAFDTALCVPVPPPNTMFGEFPASAIELFGESLATLVIANNCVNGSIPDLPEGVEPIRLTVVRTRVSEPLPDWLRDFMLESDDSVCDMSGNQFCFKPKPYAVSELLCPFSLDGTIDECGVCNGNNDTCFDCEGVVNGGACTDLCGVCNGNNTCLDCAGVPNGSHTFDACNCCGGDNSSCGLDCAGIIDGSGQLDECGVCNGDNACFDCFGVPFGSAVEDVCGVCGGTGATCTDCSGVVGGTLHIDLCGHCVDTAASGYKPACDIDCMGVAGGDAVRDLCGNCPPSESCDLSDLALVSVLNACATWMWIASCVFIVISFVLCAWAGVFAALCGRSRRRSRR